MIIIIVIISNNGVPLQIVTPYKGTFQKRFSGFCPLRGYPLTDNHFAKKPLAEMEGTPPPLNGKSPKIFLKK